MKFTSVSYQTNLSVSTIYSQVNNIQIGYGKINGSVYTPAPVIFAYKNENSISFSFTENGTDTLNSKIKLTITKDNADNTCVVCLSASQIVTGENKTNKIYTAGAETNILSLYSCVNVSGQPLTARIPLFIGNTGSYTPYFFLMPYTEYSTAGIIEMDGVRYVSNGLWCCKE